MNSITNLLNLEENDIAVSNISIEGQTKIITLETPPTITDMMIVKAYKNLMESSNAIIKNSLFLTPMLMKYLISM